MESLRSWISPDLPSRASRALCFALLGLLAASSVSAQTATAMASSVRAAP